MSVFDSPNSLGEQTTLSSIFCRGGDRGLREVNWPGQVAEGADPALLTLPRSVLSRDTFQEQTQ